MSAAQQLAAYRTVQKITSSDREIEALVLTRAAQKLAEVQNNWDAHDRDEMLDEALRYNQRIWSIFQGELLKEDNPLPRQLRTDILSLSAFIDRRIFEVMASPDPEKLKIIVRIEPEHRGRPEGTTLKTIPAEGRCGPLAGILSMPLRGSFPIAGGSVPLSQHRCPFIPRTHIIAFRQKRRRFLIVEFYFDGGGQQRFRPGEITGGNQGL